MNSLILKTVTVFIVCFLPLTWWGGSVATAQSPFELASAQHWEAYDETWKTATVEQVQAWLETKPDVDAKTPDGETVLMFASEHSTPDIVKLLLGAGADVNARDTFGYTALMEATNWNENPEVIKVLLDAGADANARVEQEYTGNTLTVLMSAIWNENPEAVQVLLEAGADVNARDKDGTTALMLATQIGNAEIIKLLREAGAQ